MYEEFYGLNGDPFRLSPGDLPCFRHASYAKARAHLQYGLHKREGIVMLAANPGLGKTSLITELDRELVDSSVSVTRITCSPWKSKDLLSAIASANGLATGKRNSASLIESIEDKLADVQLRERRQGVLILDEAHVLPAETLEQVRLLSNLNRDSSPLLQIMLVGQRNLRDKMLSPEFEQLHQRVVVSATLDPLNEQDTREYITHRLEHVGWQGKPELADDIFPMIQSCSTGIPRWINLICSRLLLNGMVEQCMHLGVNELQQVRDDLAAEDLLPAAVRRAA